MSTLKVDAIRHNSATSDAITTVADGTCTAKLTSVGGGGLSHRNKVINGAMTVSQRATSKAMGNSENAYVCVDRFKFTNVHDGAVTVSQSSTSPDGFGKSVKVDVTTADTNIITSQRLHIIHYIEAQDLQDLSYGTSGAKEARISFYVRSNKTGNYTFALNQADNSYKNISIQYTINSANTWERKSFVIPGDTAGVINDDNGTGIELYWWLAAGPTYTSGSLRSDWTSYSNGDFAAGQGVNLLDSTSNEFYLTGVQFEVGDTVTSFEHRSYAEQLLRCKRYYQRSTDSSRGTDYSLSTGTWHSADGAQSFSKHNTYYDWKQNFEIEMRVAPTLTIYGSSNQGDIHLESIAVGSKQVDWNNNTTEVRTKGFLLRHIEDGSDGNYTSGSGNAFGILAYTLDAEL